MRPFLLYLAAALYVVAGANHFRLPGFYLEIMPAYIPAPLAMVYFTGVAEVAGGLGLLFPATRRAAAWGLLLLLVAILPVHIEMVRHGFRQAPHWLLWARLPLQAVLMAWVWGVGLSNPRPARAG